MDKKFGSKAAPIALFVYKRPDHAEQVIDSLKRNGLASASDLVVFSDAPRGESDATGVRSVRKLLRGVSGFRSVEVRERPENWGLSRSITSGVSELLEQADRTVVLEDDLVVSEFFLEYMNDALTLFEDEEAVASVHGYRYPVSSSLPETFFLRGADCWGWATWRRSWAHYRPDGQQLLTELRQRRLTKAFDFDGTFPYTRMLESQASGLIDSWAIRWYASAFLADLYTLYPGESLVQNIGTDGSGEHCGDGHSFRITLADKPITVTKQAVIESAEGRVAFASYFREQRPSPWRRARERVQRQFHR